MKYSHLAFKAQSPYWHSPQILKVALEPGLVQKVVKNEENRYGEAQFRRQDAKAKFMKAMANVKSAGA